MNANNNSEYGQGIVEIAVIFFLIVIVLWVIYLVSGPEIQAVADQLMRSIEEIVSNIASGDGFAIQ